VEEDVEEALGQYLLAAFLVIEIIQRLLIDSRELSVTRKRIRNQIVSPPPLLRIREASRTDDILEPIDFAIAA
jgi:hypothetical protein